MKVERPEDQRKWWEGERFRCRCGSLITLEDGDLVRSVETGRSIFNRTFWFFFCPVCGAWVRFDDRIYYG